uniref:Uncharacterized protein n=1 Tax=Cacopsylla melanoneura TaxID=428564 RepID=A0A8D8UES9_9HEMI
MIESEQQCVRPFQLTATFLKTGCQAFLTGVALDVKPLVSSDIYNLCRRGTGGNQTPWSMEVGVVNKPIYSVFSFLTAQICTGNKFRTRNKNPNGQLERK